MSVSEGFRGVVDESVDSMELAVPPDPRLLISLWYLEVIPAPMCHVRIADALSMRRDLDGLSWENVKTTECAVPAFSWISRRGASAEASGSFSGSA
jgi:hypothetical protein